MIGQVLLKNLAEPFKVETRPT